MSRSTWALVLGILTACTAHPSPEFVREPSPGPASPPNVSTPSPAAAGAKAPEIHYVFPVEPKSVAEFGPGHAVYPATDIFCPEGSRFVAVTSGVVDFVSREDRWNPDVDDPATRGGLSVSIVGDDGIRYYGSHLSAIAAGIRPGVQVQAGQLLGLTGGTGNARTHEGTSAQFHVHFGISHPTFPEDWEVRRGEINPFPYLTAWRNGKDMRPHLQQATS